MNRISRHQLFLEICNCASKRSTCYRSNVGALIVGPDHNIRSMGYNGPPAGEPHCTGLRCERSPDGGCARSVHAEVNAIQRAGRIPDGSTLYASLSPCAGCTAVILAHTSIRRVLFQTAYRLSDHLSTLRDRGVLVGRVTPNGMVIDHFTNELVEGPSWD